MTWTSYNNGNNQEELDKLGSQLSLILHCPVRYCEAQYHKPIFECKCGIIFPVFVVSGALESNDWSQVIKRHKGEE